MVDRSPRVLLYSHDGMGLGHMRRNLRLAKAIVDADSRASVLLATGGEEIAGFGLPPRTDVVRLPGIRKVTNERYVARRLAISAREVHSVRAGLLLALVESFAPHAVVVDKHVLGAKREMSAALERARERGAAAVLGLRDILDDPADVRADWDRIGAAAAIEALYQRVLVYGAPEVASPVRDYGLPAHLAPRVHFCGYVTESTPHPTSPAPSAGRPTVVACAGGGEDGHRLLSAFVEASAGQAWRGVVVAGPHAVEMEQARLRVRAEALGLEFHDFVDDLPERLERAAAVVCMGGYNTLVESVSRGTPTVCVPRTSPRTEQLIRSRAFAAAGLLQTVEPGDLDPLTLRGAVGLAIGQDRAALRARAHELLSFDGARVAARHILDAARGATATAITTELEPLVLARAIEAA